MPLKCHSFSAESSTGEGQWVRVDPSLGLLPKFYFLGMSGLPMATSKPAPCPVLQGQSEGPWERQKWWFFTSKAHLPSPSWLIMIMWLDSHKNLISMGLKQKSHRDPMTGRLSKAHPLNGVETTLGRPHDSRATSAQTFWVFIPSGP